MVRGEFFKIYTCEMRLQKREKRAAEWKFCTILFINSSRCSSARAIKERNKNMFKQNPQLSYASECTQDQQCWRALRDVKFLNHSVRDVCKYIWEVLDDCSKEKGKQSKVQLSSLSPLTSLNLKAKCQHFFSTSHIFLHAYDKLCVHYWIRSATHFFPHTYLKCKKKHLMKNN